jgi:hypothetical protein
MATLEFYKHFVLRTYFLRLTFAIVLVFITYNPHFSYLHWLVYSIKSCESAEDLILPIFIGIALTVSWVIFLRETFRALGRTGILLALLFFIALFALLTSWVIGWERITTSPILVQYIVLTIIALVLGTGIYYQIFLRKLTGMRDVHDDIWD